MSLLSWGLRLGTELDSFKVPSLTRCSWFVQCLNNVCKPSVGHNTNNLAYTLVLRTSRIACCNITTCQTDIEDVHKRGVSRPDRRCDSFRFILERVLLNMVKSFYIWLALVLITFLQEIYSEICCQSYKFGYLSLLER